MYKIFDFDNDGDVKLFSSMKNGRLVTTSNNNEWSTNSQPIVEEEKNKCLDLQIIKKGDNRQEPLG